MHNSTVPDTGCIRNASTPTNGISNQLVGPPRCWPLHILLENRVLNPRLRLISQVKRQSGNYAEISRFGVPKY